MDVKYYGFRVEVDGIGISVSDLFAFFENEGCVIDDDMSNSRHFYFDTKTSSEYYKGLIVTVKDQKRFCRLTSESGSYQIAVENLKGKDKLLDFNFFIINKSNGLGLYQHYHQSCALNVFGTYLRKHFQQFRLSKCDAALELEKAANSGELSKRKATAVRKKFKAKLLFSPLVRREKLKEILEAYKNINAFEFEYSYISQEVRKATPLSRFVEIKKEKLTFNKQYSVKELASAVSSFVMNERPSRGRVFVEDDEGGRFPLQIFDMPDCFGIVDYDQLIIKLNGLDVEEFAKHSFINELTDIYESDDFAHIFGMELQV